MAFQCPLCPKNFIHHHVFKRHLDSVHIGEGKHVCSTCQKSFSREDSLLRHQRKHDVEENIFPCESCDRVFLRRDNLLRHVKTHLVARKRPPSPSGMQESPGKRQRRVIGNGLDGTVIDQLQNQNSDHQPSASQNSLSGENAYHDPLSSNPVETLPITSLDFQEDPRIVPNDALLPDARGRASNCDPEDLQRSYTKHWSDIRTSFHTRGKIRHKYNFRLQTMQNTEVAARAKQIFDNQCNAFKINAGFGFFLRNVETCQLQYYYASHNTMLLTKPALVTDRHSFDNFLESLSLSDPLEHVRRARPNSRWVVEMLTNVVFHVYQLRDHPIGGAPHKLPEYVTSRKALISVQSNRQKGYVYNDNLCFFRCLALHRGSSAKSLEKMTKKLYRMMFSTPIMDFKGIPLTRLRDAETKFGVNIVVYELIEQQQDEDIMTEDSATSEAKVVARLVRRSLETNKDTMYLNLCGDHFSYIKDIGNYTQSYQCRKCLKLWQHRGMLHRHEVTCDGAGVKHSFPGGVYEHPKSIFELLEEEGVHIPEELRYHPHRAVFDFECCFEQANQEPQQGKLTWDAKHVPLSVSICSNIPDHTEPQCFVSRGDSTKLLGDMLNYLTEVSQVSASLLQQIYQPYIEEMQSRIVSEAKEFDELCRKREKHAQPRQHYLRTLLDKLMAYLSELPVIGFNSGSYDINLVKEYLFPWLVENDHLKFLVKRNNTYMAVKSKKLLFLDISNFIATGFSYDVFLRAYECSQRKGFFPYEWVTFENLDEPQLPPHSAFYSELKKSNISNEEYKCCQDAWRDEGMHSMSDFLIWYNNRDVVPFLEALEKMSQFYKDRQIDVFKDGISVPGLTMKYLFQMTGDASFALFSEKDRDLYYTFRNNQVGGPSIIFNRHQEAGKTKIRDSENVCQRIVGFDANALYLWAIMQDMPTGPYLRRRVETGFKRERSRPVSIEWLDWCAHRDCAHIQHKWNAKEKRVGLRRIPVDGFCQKTNTVYQFHGCYWHAHECHLTANKYYTDEERKVMAARKRNTKEISDYIKSLGYNYEEIYECQFYEQTSTNQKLVTFLRSMQLPLEKTCKLDQETLIQAIQDDLLFGVIECDIHVPDGLKPTFAEMCPIFKNTEISIDDIGEHMKDFAMQNDFMPKPRRSLIGSMFGKKILLATPLVKWYLEKGLKITEIYQVVEFTPKRCFQSFGEAVSDARRAGDTDPSKAIIADTMKLIGNSSYGKTITNKESHQKVSIVSEDKASKLINEITFRDLNEISKTCYEVSAAKSSISMDLPLQIGFFVYQYAKLRMLQFYYDFLDKYFDRDCWEYVEMETDSAYIAIAAESIEGILKPGLRESYLQDKHSWLPRSDTQEHAMYDKRVPGLFKVEWEGEGIVALNSKMYYCYGDKDKFSCKGINKKRNDVRKEIYLDVLRTKASQTGENKGFRVRDNKMYTYSQIKSGFTYFYPKRKVLDDGVQTTYLDI